MRTPSPPEQRAAAVLKRAKVKQLPVPVEEIATSLGAEITYEPYEGDVSGMLYRSDEGAPLIGVNSTHASTRQRFTVAHEIAHLVMHEGTSIFVDRFARVNWRNNTSNSEEIEANAFAAELLMPRGLVAREVKAALTKEEGITPEKLASRLAKTFRVSAQAMSYRLENLGVVDPIALTG